MHYTKIAIIIGNLAAAQLTTRFTDTTASAIGIISPTIGTGLPHAAGVGTPDGFNFAGCFSSKNGFPSFTQAYTSKENDPNLYAKTCLGNNFFGLFGNKCYCGSELDLTTSISIRADLCNMACPGDADVSCGGFVEGSRVMQRQVDLNILLSIYIAVGMRLTATNSDFGTET
ncbi:uncharacterized protein FMAN_15307 [Fusarium mangiferae]|uniref:WSC domain-containing protein n=1 Tax=Fusarium mangiferae TaxID=192010 RepID=A0A1L7UGN6_FUSMA|nr:uncharacterized protein FMAN_15307 [Fusarium mangiferae]CVL07175.1 uncharacterized protein FMAN_15307 [Fusarium mangiferae]